MLLSTLVVRLVVGLVAGLVVKLLAPVVVSVKDISMKESGSGVLRASGSKDLRPSVEFRPSVELMLEIGRAL